MKQLEVSIMGQSYLLACPAGGEAALTKAVAKVDEEMCAIRDAGKVRARERIAVLAALNLAYQLSSQPSAAPSSATAGAEPTTDGALPDLANLVARLDQALAADGNLL
ncbi:cell division protein ZapA [Inhella crocodyli]|jgi:cell division protein ZapA|uniref:Cell division protein ZapA n=1 Tax=Inhella crocodyli TaxID=2499851 RepID=A0A437LRL7_9BURK|nr:cell division protein ZapA [Inhella crocodyli]RVT88001.1 cell division protein ZapA [Inhella crocodyli]